MVEFLRGMVYMPTIPHSVAHQGFEITVNGQRRVVAEEADTPLLYVLRDTLGMDGTRFGCGLGQCGACTVHLDGVPTRSCVYPVSAVGRQHVTTVEGLADDGTMRALQRALIEAQAPQCGYCMSGMTMTAAALLKRTPHPTQAQIRDALEANLCRCATHLRVVRAVHAVGAGKIA
jgi:aerobic-type carbon monoxide dehydrogenase small subunit (CoxS/CutS family)